MEELLSEWHIRGVSDLMKDCGIGIEELRYLKDSDLNSIFPTPSMLGTKIKFRAKLNEWKKEKGFEAQPEDKSDEILNILLEIRDHVCTSVTKENENRTTEYNIQSFIRKYCGATKDIYVSKHNSALLTPRGRTVLVKDAVEFFLSKQKQMQSNDFEVIATQITANFKDERKETYYCKSGKFPTGKLYYTYKNSLCSLRKEGLMPLKRKREAGSETVNWEPSNKNWLKYYVTPWEEVLRRWHESFAIRKEEIKTAELSNILTEWPSYQSPFGKNLIDVDYRLLGYSNDFGLQSKWGSFCAIFKSKASDLIKDKVQLSLLADIDKISCEESRNILYFELISAALTPTCMLRKKATKQVWKASIIDSQDQFIKKVDSAENLQVELQQISQKLKEHNCSLQPLVAFIKSDGSTPYQIIGVYDSVKFTYQTVLEAVSNIFKLHFVLNLQFQKCSSLIWEFVQRYFFEIEQNISEKVSDFIYALQISNPVIDNSNC